MPHSKIYVYLLISFISLSLIACSYIQSKSNTPETNISKTLEKKSESKAQPIISWLEAFTLSTSQRNDALNSLAIPTTNKEILLRSILLMHSSASVEELKEAEQLLNNNFATESSGDENEEYHLRNYLLKLNQIYQSQKLELARLQEQINVYQRLIKKQQNKNNILENKIEALTDIEHQINLRHDKDPQQVSP